MSLCTHPFEMTRNHLLRVICQCKILEPYILITRCRIFISMSSKECTENNNVSHLVSLADSGTKKTHLKKIPTNPTCCSLSEDLMLRTAAVVVGTGWGLLRVSGDEMVVISWKSLWLIVSVGRGMLTPNCKSARSPSP